MNFMGACSKLWSLRLLQPWAQALDLFIVRLALLLLHSATPKASTRCFFLYTRSRVNSRTTGLYLVRIAAGPWLLFAVFIFGFFCSLVGW